MKLLSTLLIATLLLSSISTTTAFAALVPSPSPICAPLFNGGATCQQSNFVEINKKVLDPKLAAKNETTFTDADFVENVSQKDTGYTPSTPTAFRIYVTNKTNKELKDVLVSDVFPRNFLTFVTGNGTFDPKTHTFSTKITLKAKESKKITIQVLTASNDEITRNNAPLCTINVATATINNKMSQDNSMLCVTLAGNTNTSAPIQPTPTTKPNPPQTKGGLPVVSPIAQNSMKKTPPTGPEALVLFGLLPAGLLGHLLRKKS